MGKIICAYSGVEFSCEHLPLSISSREIAHPLFNISKKRLIALAAQWSLGKLTHTESYLLYLSLLNSTNLIEWRTPATYTSKTPAILANNMEQLLHIIGKIDIINHPAFVLPHFVISPDTCSLENSYHWIQIWNQNYNDWHTTQKSHANDQEILQRELALNRLIKTPHRRIEDYPKILAQWAAVAGSFPDFQITIKGVKMEIGDYWQSIIIKCANEKTIFQVPEYDLTELYNHCIDNVVTDGSLNGITLIRYLKRGIDMQRNYLGLGDIDLASQEGTAYRILKPNESAEDANIQNMIDTAPTSEPLKSQYPNLISYIKAKARWTIAQNYASPPPSLTSPLTSPITSI